MDCTSDLPAGAPSTYFDKPEIALDPGEVLVFACLKNEAIRLPHFLDYYRGLGVRHFFIVDNASVDGSGDYLRAQPDVHCFHTGMSYRGSSAGRLWLQELCDHYGTGHWCLTVDVDELLVFPAVEQTGLPTLCRYLDLEGVAGLFCVFLDMYSDRPLRDTLYAPGQPFLEVCNHFETDSYVLRPGGNPPFLNVFGGPRGRSFLEKGGKRQGPMMKKVPLVRWHKGFSYIFSTHSHMHLPLSDMTGALLHFKFFDFFTDLAAYEHRRGDRRQAADYAHYAANMSGDTCFLSPQSWRYRRSTDLVELGVMRASGDFRDFCIEASRDAGPAAAQALRRCFPKPRPDPPLRDGNQMTIRWIGTVWPLVNNHRMAAFFSNGIATRRAVDRPGFLRLARRDIRLLDLDPGGLCLHVGEEVLARHADPHLSLVCFVGERFGFRHRVAAGRLAVDETALQAAVHRLPVDWGRLPQARPGLLEDLHFHVVADESLPDTGFGTQPRSCFTALLGPEIARVPVFALTPEAAADPGPKANAGSESGHEPVARRIAGQLDGIRDGTARGSCRVDGAAWPVALYLNGRFAALSEPGEDGRFALPLPLGYFFEKDDSGITLDLRPLGSNLSLDRVPMQIRRIADHLWLQDPVTAGAGHWIAITPGQGTKIGSWHLPPTRIPVPAPPAPVRPPEQSLRITDYAWVRGGGARGRRVLPRPARRKPAKPDPWHLPLARRVVRATRGAPVLYAALRRVYRGIRRWL
ncbi:glycosyltransferase family 2 protein [Frigidibacter sp. ROC022]|uniref:glycosyltransferase family 2 protein n=1 Tax=Frigidibacter sp. ROC022 TaxID=2971796 RepID=UPI00215B07D1|nr:glycosyltransferase family 2 protein [Frigidibacter sp. ROC022]MCR8726825.1 glycosyltransferase family 2 protein [Frigidibacter sp. ROC022]